MSEMLGNQYFMARNYNDAIKEFEDVVTESNMNKAALKKLIICYTQVGNVTKALETFHNLITEDIEFIIDTDAVKDDCPCPELVNKSENSPYCESESFDYYTMLGILWLYCDIKKSILNFQKALEIDDTNELVQECYSLINHYIEENGFPAPKNYDK